MKKLIILLPVFLSLLSCNTVFKEDLDQVENSGIQLGCFAAMLQFEVPGTNRNLNFCSNLNHKEIEDAIKKAHEKQ